MFLIAAGSQLGAIYQFVDFSAYARLWYPFNVGNTLAMFALMGMIGGCVYTTVELYIKATRLFHRAQIVKVLQAGASAFIGVSALVALAPLLLLALVMD